MYYSTRVLAEAVRFELTSRVRARLTAYKAAAMALTMPRLLNK